MKTITECEWFGVPGPLSLTQLVCCGCERCRQEIEQARELQRLLDEWRKGQP